MYFHTAPVPIKMPCPRSPLEEMSSKSMARNMLDGTEDLIAAVHGCVTCPQKSGDSGKKC